MVGTVDTPMAKVIDKKSLYRRSFSSAFIWMVEIFITTI